MSGIVVLEELLGSMQPELLTEEFVFCSVSGTLRDYANLNAWAAVQEAEGLTLVLERSTFENSGRGAQTAQIEYTDTRSSGVYRCISLRVHSSLEAVGLTAAISAQLASHRISANIIAGFYHDHLFVPAAQAQRALTALLALSRGHKTPKHTPPP